MNKWECQQQGCDVIAIGTGGAWGLRAIGWYFVSGGPIFCPAHRPDPIDCYFEGKPVIEDGHVSQCSSCAADVEADLFQTIIQMALGVKPIFHSPSVRNRP